MQIPGVHIETLHNPVRYTYAQIEKACAIAQMLNRGKLVLVERDDRLAPRAVAIDQKWAAAALGLDARLQLPRRRAVQLQR